MREQNQRRGDSTADGYERDPLLAAFADSIQAETANAGLSQLRQTVLNYSHSDHGRLVAAALVTCAAAAELDDYATCDAVLDASLDHCERDKSPDASLMRAALFQQRALRNRDAGRPYEGLAQAAIAELVNFQPELCEPFETTVVYENFALTLQNIQLALEDAAHSLLPFETRPPRPSRGQPDQIRFLNAMKGEGYAGVLAQNFAFHATGTPSNQTNILGPTDPFYVVLGLELLGHHDVYAARKELAQTRVVDLQTQGRGDIREVPRLLRHSGAKRDLELMLRWLTANGPLEVLLADTRQILSRRSDVYALRTLELRVIRASAPLLAPEEKKFGRDAIKRVLDAGGPFDLPGQHELSYLRSEQAWLTFASLADTPQSIETFSQLMLVEVRNADPEEQLLDRALATALNQLDWSVLGHGDTAGWNDWLQASNDQPGREVRRVVEHGLGTLSEVNELHQLNTVAERIDRLILGLTDDAEFGPLELDVVREAMRNTRTQAARGMFSMGGIPESDVAAALITRAGVTELWTELTDFLTDPAVLSEHKGAAFDRLASSRQPLPESTREAMSAHAQALLYPSDGHSIIKPSIRPFPPALRLLAASNCIPRSDVAAAISTLMEDPEAPARREAARTAGLILEASEDPWLLGLVLHMSYDSDAWVRAYAGHGLVSGLSTTSAWDQFATDRVRALLTADGTTSVTAILSALKDAKFRVPKVLLPNIEELASNHISGAVRRTARALLSHQA
ncbi:hypothetical protein WBG06_25190 [Nocardioides sp. CCNWLW239]|uniref:hypothetical protein n=1 Tax=Nocardioides sp. CCNWLW239 TaxID=3128902 RepID=UPI003018F19C